MDFETILEVVLLVCVGVLAYALPVALQKRGEMTKTFLWLAYSVTILARVGLHELNPVIVLVVSFVTVTSTVCFLALLPLEDKE